MLHEAVRLEIAVDHPLSVTAAVRGGAERLELCSSLADGGLTPSIGLLTWTLGSVPVPVHCMVRPRAGNFVYSPAELAVMLQDVQAMRSAGAHGIVVGPLTPALVVDEAALRELVLAARPMRVCFHRAFDLAADRVAALDAILRCGVDILLTSGGAESLEAGAAEVSRIVHQARGRLEVMGGAGVRSENAERLWQTLPLDTLHASLRTSWPGAAHIGPHTASMGSRDEEEILTVREEDVRALLSLLAPRVLPVS